MATARLIALVVGIALLLTLITFRGMGGNEFLFVHDEFIVLQVWDARDSFSLIEEDNFGSYNAPAVLVNFFDRIYYLTTLTFGIDFSSVQRGLYLLKIILLFLLSALGFNLLGRLFLGEKIHRMWMYGIALWYAGNTFTLIYWNNNAFPLTILLCYALGPLAVYVLHRAIFGLSNSYRESILASMALFCMSFALPLFLAFGIFFLVYATLFFLIKLRMGKQNNVQFSKIVIKNGIQLMVVSFPVLLHYGFLWYGMVAIAPQTMNLEGGETFGSLKGGVLYQFLQWFSWGIYTQWKPKSIFSFASYFKEWYSLIAPFCIYGLIATGNFVRNLRNPAFIATLATGLIMMLLVKGGQAPWGVVYLFLIEHLSVFRVFRSPDTKFGFAIILALSILLIFSYRESRRWVLFVVLGFVIVVQSFLFVSGTALRGENTKNSFDRIIHVPQEYREVAEFLNRPERKFGSIMMVPNDEFGLFRISASDQYIGQSLLPKIVHLPFVRVSENGSLPTTVYRDLAKTLLNEGVLKKYTLRYYILRNDIGQIPDEIISRTDSLQLIFQNATFQVFENPFAPSLFDVDGAKISRIERVSPSEYRVSISDFESEFRLTQHMNFHNGWRLYVDDGGSFVSRLFASDIARASHVFEEASINTWLVKRTDVNSDDHEIVITVYFYPQDIFLTYMIAVGILLVGYGVYVQFPNKGYLLRKTTL